jgi:DNA-directed RNA polymerase subunit RPC12/RpoP
MIFHRCDKCGKEMEQKSLGISVGSAFSGIELCSDCSKPIIEILNRKKLLQKDLERLKQAAI